LVLAGLLGQHGHEALGGLVGHGDHHVVASFLAEPLATPDFAMWRSLTRTCESRTGASPYSLGRSLPLDQLYADVVGCLEEADARRRRLVGSVEEFRTQFAQSRDVRLEVL